LCDFVIFFLGESIYERGARWFFAFVVRELIYVDAEVEIIDALEEVLVNGDEVGRTFGERFLATKCFASGFNARFGRTTNCGLIEGGGFKNGVERVGVISLPGFVAGFDGKFAFLDSTCSIGVFAP
jgi:hypothetical protein